MRKKKDMIKSIIQSKVQYLSKSTQLIADTQDLLEKHTALNFRHSNHLYIRKYSFLLPLSSEGASNSLNQPQLLLHFSVNVPE
jgi:hypothetical protein